MKIIAAVILSMSVGSAMAAQYEIKAGSIVCFAADSYELQMKYLAQGEGKTIADCGIAGKPIPVIVVEMNMFSVSEVRAVDGGMPLFVSVEDLE